MLRKRKPFPDRHLTDWTKIAERNLFYLISITRRMTISILISTISRIHCQLLGKISTINSMMSLLSTT